MARCGGGLRSMSAIYIQAHYDLSDFNKMVGAALITFAVDDFGFVIRGEEQ